MNVLLTAFIAVAVVGSPDVLPCEGPSDCSAGDVCVAGTCRSGSGKSSVQELYPVAVPPPTLLTADAHVKAVGTRLVEQIRRDLQWSGFYSVLASDSFPSTHQVEGVSPSEVRRLLWQTSGAYRLVRVAVRPSPELGKVHANLVQALQTKASRTSLLTKTKREKHLKDLEKLDKASRQFPENPALRLWRRKKSRHRPP